MYQKWLDGVSRRAALLMMSGGAACAARAAAHPVLSATALGSSLPELEVRLKRALADHEWWDERFTKLDSGIRGHLLANAPSIRNGWSSSELAEWPGTRAYDYARENAEAAFEKVLSAELEISAVTATDLDGIMIQVQILATRDVIGFLDDQHLAAAIVRGLEFLASSVIGPARPDAAVFTACQDWEKAIDEVERAERVIAAIHIASWALPPLGVGLISDPFKKAAIETEQRRTGWDPAIEGLWAARERLEATEVMIAQTTASSVAALLMQARLLSRRLAPCTAFSKVDARIAIALARGLERMGCRRTCNIDAWHAYDTAWS